MRIQYSKPGVDMTAEAVVGGRRFALESDSSFFSSDIKVRGVLSDDAFFLKGRTKNMRNRDFTVAGQWADASLQLRNQHGSIDPLPRDPS